MAQNGDNPSAPTNGPYCYFRINLKAKATQITRYTTLYFHTISSCGLTGDCRYLLTTPVLICSPNPDKDAAGIDKTEEVSIAMTILP